MRRSNLSRDPGPTDATEAKVAPDLSVFTVVCVVGGMDLLSPSTGRRQTTEATRWFAPPLRRKAINHSEASGLGEDPCGGVEVCHASGEGGGRQAFGQGFVEFEASQCPLVHIRQAEAFGGVGRSGFPHLAGQVTAHPEAGVVEALDAVGQVGQGRGERGVGAVTGPGPPADVLDHRG